MKKFTPILSVSFFLASAGVFATESSMSDDLQVLSAPPISRELAAPPPPSGEPAIPNQEPTDPPISEETLEAPPLPSEEPDDLPMSEETPDLLPPTDVPGNPDVLPPPSPVSAARAIKISIGSSGGELDRAAVRTVRQVIGHAVARGTVGTFVDTGHREGAPIPVEGGFSFCAEMAFSSSFGDHPTAELDSNFVDFYSDLKSIHPREGTFYNVEWISECPVTIEDFPAPIIPCPEVEDGEVCPDGSVPQLIPPSCNSFTACPPLDDDIDPIDMVVCTQDVMSCPDGSYVGREPPSCEFKTCPN